MYTTLAKYHYNIVIIYTFTPHKKPKNTRASACFDCQFREAFSDSHKHNLWNVLELRNSEM